MFLPLEMYSLLIFNLVVFCSWGALSFWNSCLFLSGLTTDFVETRFLLGESLSLSLSLKLALITFMLVFYVARMILTFWKKKNKFVIDLEKEIFWKLVFVSKPEVCTFIYCFFYHGLEKKLFKKIEIEWWILRFHHKEVWL